jgi:hypothetical protein
MNNALGAFPLETSLKFVVKIDPHAVVVENNTQISRSGLVLTSWENINLLIKQPQSPWEQKIYCRGKITNIQDSYGSVT